MFETVDLRDWNEYVRLLVGLLALINPLTVLPIFLGLVQGRAEPEKRHISTVASVTVLVTLLIFTYFGGALLDLFAITIDSFRIAGGILLLLAALAAMSVMSYRELRGALVDLAGERLQGAATQMANVFGMTSRQRLGAMQQLMRRPEIAAYLETRDASHEGPIREVVKTLRPRKYSWVW